MCSKKLYEQRGEICTDIPLVVKVNFIWSGVKFHSKKATFHTHAWSVISLCHFFILWLKYIGHQARTKVTKIYIRHSGFLCYVLFFFDVCQVCLSNHEGLTNSLHTLFSKTEWMPLKVFAKRKKNEPIKRTNYFPFSKEVPTLQKQLNQPLLYRCHYVCFLVPFVKTSRLWHFFK